MATTRQSRLGIITLLAAIALGACSDSPAAAVVAPMASAETETSNISIPVDIFSEGCTEPIQLTGALHILSHFTIASSGNVHLVSQFQPQGVQGIGAFTGTIYRGTGVTRDEVNFNGSLPYTESYVNNFRLIGQGPDNNLLIHENFHITINSNGVITATHDHFTIACR